MKTLLFAAVAAIALSTFGGSAVQADSPIEVQGTLSPEEQEALDALEGAFQGRNFGSYGWDTQELEQMLEMTEYGRRGIGNPSELERQYTNELRMFSVYDSGFGPENCWGVCPPRTSVYIPECTGWNWLWCTQGIYGWEDLLP